MTTDSLETITQTIVSLLEDHTELGFEDVFYGDQDLIPRTPAAAVESAGLARELQGIATGGMTRNELSVYIFVYHCPIQSAQKTRKECDQFAEQVQRLLHNDVTLGGLVIHGFCNNSEPGVAVRGGAAMRAHRITWMGISKTRLAP
jgi:hypothetical protein